MIDKKKQNERFKRYREKRKTNAELHKLDNERARERVKQYRERHQLKTFAVKLEQEKYERITSKLKERGITQKQFVESAIDKFLKE